MRVCPRCSERYTDRIDFCFVDGEVLVDDEQDARERFRRILALQMDLGKAQEEFDRKKTAEILRRVPVKTVEKARKKAPAVVAEIDAAFAERARQWVERWSRWRKERDRALDDLAAEITPRRVEGVWTRLHRWSSADYLSQGYGSISYASGRAEIAAELLSGTGIPVRVVETPGRSAVEWAVEVETTDLDAEVLRRRPLSAGGEGELVLFVRSCWRRALNPRVYLPLLPHGFEERHGIGWQGQVIARAV